jgi:hypothetical protein
MDAFVICHSFFYTHICAHWSLYILNTYYHHEWTVATLDPLWLWTFNHFRTLV